MGLILDGVSARDLVLDGHSVSLYVGGSPPVKVWPTREVVQITLGNSMEARDQLLAALSARGLDYKTVEEIPFDIELVGTGSTTNMFMTCSALTRVPAMDTSQVTNMSNMFRSCSSLTSVPDLDTGQVTNMNYMFYNCSSLTYGNVRLIGRHPNVTTVSMISNSGLTREPFYDAAGQPWPTAEVYEVSLTDVWGNGTAHPLLTVTVPAGETWTVRIQGTITKADRIAEGHPRFRIGTSNSGRYGPGAAVDFSGTVTAANRTIALVTEEFSETSFTGTVTIEK